MLSMAVSLMYCVNVIAWILCACFLQMKRTLKIVKEDVDPTFPRTTEEYTRTLAAAIEVLRGRGTSEEYLNDFYGKYSEPEQQKALFSSTLVCGNAHVSRVVDHLGQLKLSLRQQTEVRFFGLALNPTARYITKEVGYTMSREYCETYFRSAGHRIVSYGWVRKLNRRT